MPEKSIPYTKIALFDGIAAADLEALLSCLKNFVCTYKKGSFLLLDQGQVQHVGIVLSGAVHMLKEDVWGNQTLVTYLGPGELFGESFALQKNTKSHASFLAAQDTRVLFLSLQNLLHPCPKHCPFHILLTTNMFHLLGEKTVQLLEKIEVTSKGSLREKILAYLSLQAQKQESKYITVPLSRTEMAQFLQSNRSAMTRELAAMRDEGLIDFDGDTFVLKK